MKDALTVLNQRSDELGLKINKDKSGIMMVTNRARIRDEYEGKEYDGFKYTRTYKYLGTVINDKVTIDSHIESIKPKMRAICASLTVLRVKGNLKFNSNLFELYLQPQFRLLAQLFVLGKNREKKEVVKLYKLYWKKMCCLPRSTPN